MSFSMDRLISEDQHPSFTPTSIYRTILTTITSIAFIFIPVIQLIETLLFTVGLHPAYIITRASMAFGMLASWMGHTGKDASSGIARARRVGKKSRQRSSSNSSSSETEDETEVVDMGGDAADNLSSARDLARSSRNTRKRGRGTELERANSTYPGMVNLSGTLCYMNSVLQSFASLTYLQQHLEEIIKFAEEVDLNTPVTDALTLVLEELNTPSSSPRPPPLRPYALVEALSTLPAVRRLLQTRDHQDAHELFLLLSNAVREELVKLVAERRKDVGLAAAWKMVPSVRNSRSMSARGESEPASSPLPDSPGPARQEDVASMSSSVYRAKGKERAMDQQVLSPWEGLSANRRSCLKCGYCEAIRYETMGALDVAVPMSGRIDLENCLEFFTAIEVIDDAHCDACTLRLTAAWYKAEAERLNQAKSDNPGARVTTARRKRAREARKIRDKLQVLLDKEMISGMEKQPGLEECKWVRGRSKSAKQAMIARPPPILCLHLVRSEYTPYGQVVKKTPYINYPSILDITSFTTSGALHMTADGPISRHVTDSATDGLAAPSPSTSGTSTEDVHAPPRILYRLDAIICHYGFTHSFGHFVAYRRKPDTSFGPRLASKSCPDGCSCRECEYFGQVRADDDEHGLIVPGMMQRNWLRISDADVEEVTESEALNERGSAVLLFYEKIKEYDDGKHACTSASVSGSTEDIARDDNKKQGQDATTMTATTMDSLKEAWRKNGAERSTLFSKL